MQIKPSEDHLKKWEKVEEWLIFNPDKIKFELKPETPQEIVELRQWLIDNDPATKLDLN